MSYEKIPFTLGYKALMLLGKGMYSNLWAALSELIANGIDAHAENVYVYIDMSDKQHSKIEILDDGDGMSYDDIKNKYVVIGNNKREEAKDASLLMGRKGVGKLAALFLTNKYEFLTKKQETESSIWLFDFSNKNNATPMLEPARDNDFELYPLFNKKNHGTLLKLFDVNLTNMAEEAINALSLIMANYFLYENLPKVRVCFYTRFLSNEIVDFDKPLVMEKKIAFNNMIALISDNSFNKPQIEKAYEIPLSYGEIFENEYLRKYRKDENFASVPETSGTYETINDKGEKISITEVNVLVLFLDSVHSMRSQYCMFEGGAFWATRAIKDCIHVHFGTKWIPSYINDNKKYHVPLNESNELDSNAFILTPKKYNESIPVLNKMIEHLNRSSLHTTDKIPYFTVVSFPSEIALKRLNEGQETQKTMLDYMDKDYVDCWNLYVIDGETDLLKDGTRKSQTSFIKEYNEDVRKMN